MIYIRKRREALGMTPTELGDRVGVSCSAICQIESGAVTPTLKTALALASVLHCAVEDLTREVSESA